VRAGARAGPGGTGLLQRGEKECERALGARHGAGKYKSPRGVPEPRIRVARGLHVP
jgi:hypothetical protein